MANQVGREIHPSIKRGLYAKADEGYDVYIEYYNSLDQFLDCFSNSQLRGIHNEIMAGFQKYSKSIDPTRGKDG